jgi:acetylornithine deacetylase/succinyl-diaminopimelate desuccinylase-like protein
MSTDTTIYQRPVELLQKLLRFDTTNPPGNEQACISWIERLLTAAGLETTILAREPLRPNLLARLPGRGQAPPLLLYGHVDVVTTSGQDWTHPPFAGVVANDFVWGRGTLDMKGGVTMMLAALLRARHEGQVPAGDIVLAVLSDEEAGGDLGARFLVEEHAARFEGITAALGEFGGATMYFAGRRMYPIQMAEKQLCWLRATVRGPGGHGSRSFRGGAMAKLGALLTRLDQTHLPVHITPVARRRIEAMAAIAPRHLGFLLRRLLSPRTADRALMFFGPGRQAIDPWLRNTVNATIVRGGEKINVIPSELELELDGRLLPGLEPEDLIAELRPILGKDVTVEITRYDPGPVQPTWDLFPLLATILEESDPRSTAMPMLLPAFTDGRFFARLGIQTYGFTPMKLEPGFNLFDTIHAADERIPVEALHFGCHAMHQALIRYPGLRK